MQAQIYDEILIPFFYKNENKNIFTIFLHLEVQIPQNPRLKNSVDFVTASTSDRAQTQSYLQQHPQSCIVAPPPPPPPIPSPPTGPWRHPILVWFLLRGFLTGLGGGWSARGWREGGGGRWRGRSESPCGVRHWQVAMRKGAWTASFLPYLDVDEGAEVGLEVGFWDFRVFVVHGFRVLGF